MAEYNSVNLNAAAALLESLGADCRPVDATNVAERSLGRGRLYIGLGGDTLRSEGVLTISEVLFPAKPDTPYSFTTTTITKEGPGDPSPLIATRQMWKGETADSPPPEDAPVETLEYSEAQTVFGGIREIIWAAKLRDRAVKAGR
jgi:hypothetical protein